MPQGPCATPDHALCAQRFAARARPMSWRMRTRKKLSPKPLQKLLAR